MPESPPTYTKYRARPRLLDRGGSTLDRLRRGPGEEPGKQRRPITWGRVVKWLVLAILGWIALSLVVFLISAQIQQSKVDDAADKVLAGGGAPPFSPTTVLFLGSDQRAKGTKEPGASTSGPSRSDSILLMRRGGGPNRRLSVPPDPARPPPGAGASKSH